MKLPDLLRLATYAIAIVTMAACAQQISRDSTGSHSSTVAQQLVVPSGIATFSNSTVAFEHGIYANYTSDGCCFLAGQSSLALLKPSGSRRATLHFFVPSAKPYSDHGLTIALHIGSAAVTQTLKLGDQSMSISFPPQYVKTTSVPLRITATPTFVPKALGMNNDARSLSALLLSVTYSS